MARLTRAQQQQRTRAFVLAAAREEFAEYGYGPAKVDRIAERAELTRGAVYSNFPSKRALYLAVLTDLVEHADVRGPVLAPVTVADALGTFARVWLERLPLAGESEPGGRLRLRSLAGVLDGDHGRAVLAQVMRLEALLLGVALESCDVRAPRRVRLAELALTLLGGSAQLAETAPGFGDPFDVVRACEHLAGADLGDNWAPAYLPHVSPARPSAAAWQPPQGLTDEILREPVDLGADGLVTVLGAGRLAAAEEAIRSALPGEQVTIALVTGDPAETGRLVRMRILDLATCLAAVFSADVWQRIHLVLDDDGWTASALGLAEVDDETEVAVRVRDGVIAARARGRGAAYAVSLPVKPARRKTKR
ncbi:TetR/AcrR family transcriptional regulator [Amycolatopsis suaedae]|uniref:TetR/AcrR family transcriptional regulator n=1 Tax=Amycolatopsis suaedae TaxID=2510978 RepID=A0A4Q7J5H9_9PSEU|nr:TetR/AcrR family transcriptional regulator [Amycolatopsis suaedae]RZQ62359.1 TetR/AcrR family transcriptional regulator [Amycolatopsis suaedae]